MFAGLFLFATFSALLSLAGAWPPTSGNVYLDEEQQFMLNWLTRPDGIVSFYIYANTSGYVGLGIVRPGKDVDFVDVFVGGTYLNKSSIAYGIDAHLLEGVLTQDVQSDWVLLSSSYSESGGTTVWVQRHFDTCDEEGDVPLTNDTITVAYFMGETDDYENREGERSGRKLINLQSHASFNLTGFHTWSPKMETELPPHPTVRWCSIQEWVNPDTEPETKHHFVGFEPVVTFEPGQSRPYHIYLHKCNPPPDVDAEEFFGEHVGKNGACTDDPEFPVGQCVGNYVYAWSTGGEPMILPENVGIPVSDVAQAKSYFALEVHFGFDPEESNSYNVSVGILAYHTNETREHEAGTFQVKRGDHPSLVDITIPPRSSDFVLSAHCSRDCTQSHFPPSGITLFHNLVNSHLLGQKMKLRHFRENNELPWIDGDDTWAYAYQQNRHVPLINVNPGDQIVLECRYDNSENSIPVTGGLSEVEEACSTLLWYYPKMDNQLSCGSEDSLDTHLNYFGINSHTLGEPQYPGGPNKMNITAPEELAGDYLDSLTTKFTWSNEFLEGYRHSKWYGEQQGFCRSGESRTARINPVSYPEDLIVYVPEDRCNPNAPTTTTTTSRQTSTETTPSPETDGTTEYTTDSPTSTSPSTESGVGGSPTSTFAILPVCAMLSLMLGK